MSAMQNAGTDEGVAAGLRASRITSLDDALAACHALSACVGRDKKERYGIGDLRCFMSMTQNLELHTFRETDVITVPPPPAAVSIEKDLVGISIDDLSPIGVAQPGAEGQHKQGHNKQEAQHGQITSGAGLAALVSLLLADLCSWMLSSEATCVRRTCRALYGNGGSTDSLAAFEAHRRRVRSVLQLLWRRLSTKLEVRLASRMREGDVLRILASAVDCLDSCDARLVAIESDLVAMAVLRIGAKFTLAAELDSVMQILASGATLEKRRTVSAVEHSIMNLPCLALGRSLLWGMSSHYT